MQFNKLILHYQENKSLLHRATVALFKITAIVISEVNNKRRNFMLILTRRIDETLMIGDKIHVKVLGIKGNQVRIGIIAPTEVSVHRKEIYDKIKLQEVANNEQKRTA